MKLQIIKQDQEEVRGYEVVFVDRNQLDLTKVADNECEFILASDIMDSFSGGDSSKQVLQALRTKLRLNGTVVVGGTDVRLFAKAVLSGVLPLDAASNIVTGVHSMTSSIKTEELLKSLGLTIESVTLDGLHYEIKATRAN